MALAILTHLVVSSFAAVVLGLIAGTLNTLIAVVSLEFGAAAGIWVWWRSRNEGGLFPGITFVPALLYGFIIFAGVQHFLYLLYYEGHGLRTLHLNNFGDLSMHIQYIRHMASGAHFWPDNPEYAGELLRYPLGIDLYNTLWEILGVPIDSHLFVVGAVMTIVAVALLHQWMGWWGVGAFFLNGGLANWKAVFTGRLNDFQNEVAWKNFFLSLWITQRGFLYAIPAGVYVIKMITETLLGERELSRYEKILCGLLWSGLAFFHLHSFFIVSLFLFICIVLYRRVLSMIEVLIPVGVVGLLFTVFSTRGFSSATIVHLKWGWVSQGQNLLAFWLVNLGPWLFLGAATIFFVFKKPHARFRAVAVAVFALFFAFTGVMVAPWDWDNIKILLWLYLVIAWLVWRTWLRDLSAAVAFVIGCLVFFPGAISLVSSLPGNSQGAELYRAEELWEAKAALMDVPKDAVLAVAPDPNHPAMFWGVKVAMAYPGHLWSHGIQYGPREGVLEDMLKGREGRLSAARDIGVTHIYWGENEKRKYGAFHPQWLSLLKNVSRSSRVDVYLLQGYHETAE